MRHRRSIFDFGVAHRWRIFFMKCRMPGLQAAATADLAKKFIHQSIEITDTSVRFRLQFSRSYK
jgi:hypothetical protein